MVIAVTKGLEADEPGELSILPDVLERTLPEGIREEVRLAPWGAVHCGRAGWTAAELRRLRLPRCRRR